MITLLRREVYYMDINKLKQEVIEYSKQIGIDKIGFTNANPFDELKNRLIRQQELNYQSGFEEPDIEKRVTPSMLLEEPRSIISIALAYPSKIKSAFKVKKAKEEGSFAGHHGVKIIIIFFRTG